jgi:hypothetical protein
MRLESVYEEQEGEHRLILCGQELELEVSPHVEAEL